VLKLVTGLPGTYKTAFTLDEFLKIKNRPKYATPINGLDFEKHGIEPISDLTKWTELPDGSAVLVDEGQQYLRPRKKDGDLPQWISSFETHRHRGMDFFVTTQNPMLIDVHFRRLVGKHFHYNRFSGLSRVSRRIWERCIDDPNDYHATKLADQQSVKVNKDIFKEYTSTVQDTHKLKIPPKLLFWIPFILILITISGFMGAPVIKKWWGNTHNNVQLQSTPSIPNNLQATNNYPTTQSNLSDRKTLTPSDFVPVTELAPWSAPLYRDSAHIVSVPRFAGCIQMKNDCKCVTQQGTSLTVDATTCKNVIHGDGMPFNPFHDESVQPRITNMQAMDKTTSSDIQREHIDQQLTSANDYEALQDQKSKKFDADWKAYQDSKTRLTQPINDKNS
jgi:zona occludens toxin